MACTVFAQPLRILHYTETSGFDHQTRTVAQNMFEALGLELGFAVDHDSTGAHFDSLQTLLPYAIVVFSNTSGNNILNATQRQNFEDYIMGGGQVLGIHSATDTYRHSTANGSNTGTWDFYAELIGASVQEGPNHVQGQPFYHMIHLQNNALLAGIPNPWYKAEEYYYWESGYFDSLNNQVLMQVETTVSPDTFTYSYDSARAMTWYRITQAGGKVFYTALGHAPYNYTSDTTFIQLIANALIWMLSPSMNPEALAANYNVYPHPVVEDFFLAWDHEKYRPYAVLLWDELGRPWLMNCEANDGRCRIPSATLPPGTYVLHTYTPSGVHRQLMVKAGNR